MVVIISMGMQSAVLVVGLVHSTFSMLFFPDSILGWTQDLAHLTKSSASGIHPTPSFCLLLVLRHSHQDSVERAGALGEHSIDTFCQIEKMTAGKPVGWWRGKGASGESLVLSPHQKLIEKQEFNGSSNSSRHTRSWGVCSQLHTAFLWTSLYLAGSVEGATHFGANPLPLPPVNLLCECTHRHSQVCVSCVIPNPVKFQELQKLSVIRNLWLSFWLQLSLVVVSMKWHVVPPWLSESWWHAENILFLQRFDMYTLSASPHRLSYVLYNLQSQFFFFFSKNVEWDLKMAKEGDWGNN